MATIDSLPLVVITGPTASGKSAVAMAVAEKVGGEIICADSRTIYKYMDIGTAKPSAEDRARVPHWGLDLVEPGEPFTAADFKRHAVQKIEEIRARGNVPMLVGGTGLYIDAVIFDYQFGPTADPAERQKLMAMSLEELHKYCSDNNITLPDNLYNKRYVVRAIEQKSISGKRRESPIENTIIVGITTDREALRERIAKRADGLFASGMIEEAEQLGETYGWDNEAMTGNIYRLVAQYKKGELTEAELLERFITLDWQLAKRQLTWLKRNPFIQWLPLDQAEQFLTQRLAS